MIIKVFKLSEILDEFGKERNLLAGLKELDCRNAFLELLGAAGPKVLSYTSCFSEEQERTALLQWAHFIGGFCVI